MKNKVPSCVRLDSEIKFIGSIIAKNKGLTFSDYVEDLIYQDYLNAKKMLEGIDIENKNTKNMEEK